MRARPWSATASGVALVVRLTPKGGRDCVDGIASLSDGRSVLKAGGATTRLKRIAIDGDAAALIPRLEKLTAAR